MARTRNLVAFAAALAATVLIARPAPAQEQTPPVGPPLNGVVAVPQVDPGIKAQPPLAPSRLPTPVIAPPGTPGGQPDIVPK